MVKNAQAGQRAIVSGFLHENGFGKIHLARDVLHGVVRKAVAVGDDRQRIAFEAIGGENVQRVEAMFHKVFASSAAMRVQMLLSCGTVLSLTIFPVFKVDFGSISTT